MGSSAPVPRLIKHEIGRDGHISGASPIASIVGLCHLVPLSPYFTSYILIDKKYDGAADVAWATFHISASNTSWFFVP
jgi:hypothetical protein